MSDTKELEIKLRGLLERLVESADDLRSFPSRPLTDGKIGIVDNGLLDTAERALRDAAAALSPPSQGKPPSFAPGSVTYVPGPDVSGLVEAAKELQRFVGLKPPAGVPARAAWDALAQALAAFQSRQERK